MAILALETAESPPCTRKNRGNYSINSAARIGCLGAARTEADNHVRRTGARRWNHSLGHRYLAQASQPLKDIAVIILDTGLRPDEAFRIETGNLDFVGRTIFNPFGKTDAARRKVTMTEAVFDFLKARALKSAGPFVFHTKDNPDTPIGSVRKAHDAAIRRAGLVHFHLYDLRHTFAKLSIHPLKLCWSKHFGKRGSMSTAGVERITSPMRWG